MVSRPIFPSLGLEPQSLGLGLGTMETQSSLMKLIIETKIENRTLNYNDNDIPKHLDIAIT